MLAHKHENLTELHTLMSRTIPATKLTRSHNEDGYEYPVSGDVLSIVREAHKINELELAVQIIGERTARRIEHNV